MWSNYHIQSKWYGLNTTYNLIFYYFLYHFYVLAMSLSLLNICVFYANILLLPQYNLITTYI